MGAMSLKFTAVQRRVLGVLVEKALTTPAAYPLTLNALVAGCNQLSCRDPVMRLTDDEVARALRELQERQLVAEIGGARVERYRHELEARLGWNEYRQAVIAELLLRGAQTPGELKANASRMAALPDLDAVHMILEAFATQDPPVVRELPRQPGKSAARFDHLLYADGEPARAPAAPAPPPADSLEARVARLEAEVAALREAINKKPVGP